MVGIRGAAVFLYHATRHDRMNCVLWDAQSSSYTMLKRVESCACTCSLSKRALGCNAGCSTRLAGLGSCWPLLDAIICHSRYLNEWPAASRDHQAVVAAAAGRRADFDLRSHCRGQWRYPAAELSATYICTSAHAGHLAACLDGRQDFQRQDCQRCLCVRLQAYRLKALLYLLKGSVAEITRILVSHSRAWKACGAPAAAPAAAHRGNTMSPSAALMLNWWGSASLNFVSYTSSSLLSASSHQRRVASRMPVAASVGACFVGCMSSSSASAAVTSSW